MKNLNRDNKMSIFTEKQKASPSKSFRNRRKNDDIRCICCIFSIMFIHLHLFHCWITIQKAKYNLIHVVSSVPLSNPKLIFFKIISSLLQVIDYIILTNKSVSKCRIFCFSNQKSGLLIREILYIKYDSMSIPY